MNRLTVLTVLACFIAQQFTCCCDGSATVEHGHERHGACLQGAGPSAFVFRHSHQHGHDCAAHNHDDDCDCPENGEHEHHLCVGSHLFYTVAPHFELPQFDGGHCWFGDYAGLADHLTLPVLVTATDCLDGGPPLAACPRRSALCVYRI